MFRWLLIFLVAVQIGLPIKGACRAGEMRPAKVECCSVDHEVSAAPCCHGKQAGTSNTQQPVKTDCDGQGPCCGCCLGHVLFCWLPDVNFRFEPVNVDRVETRSDALSGITHVPPTPPPNFDGVC